MISQPTPGTRITRPQTRLIASILSGLFGLLFAYLSYSRNGADTSDIPVHTLVGGALAMAYLVYVSGYRKQSIFGPGTIYLAYVLVSNLAIPFFAVFDDVRDIVPSWYLADYQSKHFVTAIVVINIYLFAFLVTTILLHESGLWHATTTQRDRGLVNSVRLDRFIVIVFVVSVSVTILQLLAEGIHVGMTYHEYRSSLSNLSVALYGLRFGTYCVVVSAVRHQSARVRWMVAVLSVIMAVLALIGERSQLFFPLLTCLVVYQRDIGLTRAAKVTLVAVLPIALFFIGWIKESRSGGVYSLPGMGLTETMRSALTEMGGAVVPLMYCIRYVDVDAPLYGYSIAVPLLRVITKRLPFVDTVDFTRGGSIGSELFAGHAFGFNGIGEQYLNGGLVGVAIGAFVTALFMYAVAYDRRSSAHRIFWGITFWYLLYVVRNSYTGWFGTLMINLLFVGLLQIVDSYELKRRRGIGD